MSIPVSAGSSAAYAEYPVLDETPEPLEDVVPNADDPQQYDDTITSDVWDDIL